MTRRRDPSRTAFIVSFLAPAVAVYAIFVVVPLLQALQISLYRWRGVSVKRTFVGLENFGKLLHDDSLLRSLHNALWLLVFAFLAVFAGGIAAAHALNRPGRLSRTVRGLVLFPQVVSVVAVAVLWEFLLRSDATVGLVNGLLALVGIHGRVWLGESSTALPSVGVVFVWQALGFYVLLFLAGIKGIAAETMEAAELDGSTGLHRLRTITWPLLWSVKRIAAIYLVINVLNVFALVLLLTNGGPDRHTEMPLTYLYEQAFTNSEFGYATSIAVVDFALAMLLSLLVMVVYRRNPTEART
jgi:N-acetylglucosamine transport system permease protein